MRVHDLINEIKEMRQNTPRKSAFDIYNILANNRTLFIQHVAAADLDPIITNFENLVNASTRDYLTERYKDEFEKNFHLLSFYLNRVI